MAKMIMMNELNKRANLLIEQLEKISEDFQRRLEDQLQGAIEMCSQLDHVQNFISWATAHHLKNPLLFSRELISLQMQRLLEPPLHSDAWLPVKIKFNWDASYWTKQISTLGQLTAEGGNRSYSEGVAFPSILRPQPITCLSLPSVCHGGREQGCAFQACCQPQMCCLHCIPPQPAVQLDKTQREPNPYSARCAQSTLSSPSLALHQSQLLRCRGPDSPPGPPAVVPSSMQRPPAAQHISRLPTQACSAPAPTVEVLDSSPQPQPSTSLRFSRFLTLLHSQQQTGPGKARGQQASRERGRGERRRTPSSSSNSSNSSSSWLPLEAELTVEQQGEEQQEARTTQPSRDCRDGRDLTTHSELRGVKTHALAHKHLSDSQ
ncbi:tripartite motif-containing protein 66-like [Coregonus clupeaformis]|uniref:tripartite motif-containing protein 66-like n=1 Tax=Coregonus clupeaformis TaxID=59861 RepID=UPI001E1C7D01|nr:tripartite motif-containing protein 66-like [Coregonus clupeaformis]